MNIALLQKKLTMSSVEIAELTGKRHDNVMRDISNMLHSIYGGVLSFEDTHINPQNGKEYRIFILPKDETLCLLSGYDAVSRMKIIRRWQELEAAGGLQLPKTLPEALRLAADLAEQNAQQQLVIEQQQPSVEFVEKLVDRTGLMTATEVAQKHKISAMKLNLILDKIGGVYSKSVKRSRVFCQTFIDKGYGQMKQTDVGHSQCLFTTAGEFYVSKLLKHYFEQNN